MTASAATPARGAYHLTSCGVLSKANASYVLDKDLTSPGTCISIQSDGITLDLNGHTITYATEPETAPRHGILAEACWDTSLAGNPCGGSADRLTVFNGTITQGSGAAPYSHAIQIGQINGANHLVVHDVVFNIGATSSIPVFTTFSGSGSSIYKNTIHNNVTVILNRHQIQGASIKFQNTQGSGPGQTIHDNKIVGGPQGGIFSSSPGSQFFGNTIDLNGRYSNDFGIYAWGTNDQAYNNTIEPVSGRGIQIAGGAVNAGGPGAGARSVMVHDNKISVIELQQNCDYSAGGTACNVCELAGAFGIQFDDGPSDGSAFNNSVEAKADQCDAQALRLTDIGTGNSSHDNNFTAERTGEGPGKAWAIGTGGAPHRFIATNDTFVADSAVFHADWEGMPGGFLCIHCTLRKGGNPSPDFVTFSFENGRNPVVGLHFQDTIFEGGAVKESTDMRSIGSSRQYSEYFIDWTYSLEVQDAQGKPVPGAAISVKDATDNTVYRGISDDKGQISVVLNEFKKFNTNWTVKKEMHTPHTIYISNPSCEQKENTLKVIIDHPTHQTYVLECSGNNKLR